MMSTDPRPDAENWMVTCWPEGGCPYPIISLYATRVEAVAAVARHPGTQLMFRAVPAPTPDPRDQF